MIGMRGLIAGALILGWACGGMAQAPDLSRMDLVLKSTPDGPVASVHGRIIPKEEFVALYRNELALEARRLNTTDPEDLARVQVAFRTLMMLVERELLLVEADRRKITVTEQEIGKALEEELEMIQNALAQGADRELTQEEILQQAGATREEAIEEIRKLLRIEKTRKAIIDELGIKVGKDEVKAFYEENKDRIQQPGQMHLKQMYWAAGKDVSADKRKAARAKAEDALKRIRAGQTFESVARAVSEGRFKEQGGDPGMLPISQIPPFLVDAARHLKPGELSGVIESDYGYHVISLVETVAAKETTLAEATPRIERMLLARKGDDAVREYCRKLAESSNDVRVYLDLDRQLSSRPDLLEQMKKGAQ